MKKLGLVLVSSLAVAAGMTMPSALGATTGPKVTVVVKTAKKTLLDRAVRGERGSITKGGTPRGKCSGDSAAGALDLATHGRWTGKYYKGIGIFVTSILGVKPSGSHYWGFFVNGKTSSKGVCDVKLRRGERLLFKVL